MYHTYSIVPNISYLTHLTYRIVPKVSYLTYRTDHMIPNISCLLHHTFHIVLYQSYCTYHIMPILFLAQDNKGDKIKIKRLKVPTPFFKKNYILKY